MPSEDELQEMVEGTHAYVALRFYNAYKDRFMYVARDKQWYIWTGKYWKPDYVNLIYKAAEKTGSSGSGVQEKVTSTGWCGSCR